jgi:hypothetical protein
MSFKSQMDVLRNSGLCDPPSMSTYPISVHVPFAEELPRPAPRPPELSNPIAMSGAWAVPLIAAACLAGYVAGGRLAGQGAGYRPPVDSRVAVSDDDARAADRSREGHGGLASPSTATGYQMATPIW